MSQHTDTLRELTHRLFDGQISIEEYRRAIDPRHPHPHGALPSEHAMDTAVYSIKDYPNPLFTSGKDAADRAIPYVVIYKGFNMSSTYIIDETPQKRSTREMAGKPNEILFCTPEAEAMWFDLRDQVRAEARAQKLFPEGLEWPVRAVPRISEEPLYPVFNAFFDETEEYLKLFRSPIRPVDS